MGEEGVFDFEDYEDVGLSERVIEHGAEDSQNLFADLAFQRKKESMQSAMSAQSKARDSVSVRGPELSLEAVLGLVANCNVSGSSNERPVAGSCQDPEAEDADTESSGEESDSEPEGPLAGLALLTPAAKAKNRSKSAASSSKAPGKAAPAASAKTTVSQPFGLSPQLEPYPIRALFGLLLFSILTCVAPYDFNLLGFWRRRPCVDA